MAKVDKNKFKKKKRLGDPPKIEEIEKSRINNLDQPETFTPAEKKPAMEIKKIDGRTLRKTGYTIQFGTKVNKGFKPRLIKITMALKKQDPNITFGKILAEALKRYEKDLEDEGVL